MKRTKAKTLAHETAGQLAEIMDRLIQVFHVDNLPPDAYKITNDVANDLANLVDALVVIAGDR